MGYALPICHTSPPPTSTFSGFTLDLMCSLMVPALLFVTALCDPGLKYKVLPSPQLPYYRGYSKTPHQGHCRHSET